MYPYTNDSPSVLTVKLSRDEAATIYYALIEHKKLLLETALKAGDRMMPNYLEDQAFCYRTAGEIAQLQFDVFESFHEDETIRVRLDL
jgi:hypothetical protein